MKKPRLFTGSRFVAIPDIDTSRCGIMDLSFVYMLYRSIVELHGTDEEPFLQPVVSVGGKPLDLSTADWDHELYWIPSFDLADSSLEVHSKIFCALDHRGFVWTMELESKSDSPLEIEFGWNGCWAETCHVLNVSKPVKGERFGSVIPRFGGMPLIEFRGTTPLFAVAFCPSEPMDSSVWSDRTDNKPVIAAEGETINYKLSQSITLQPGERKTVALYVGFGLEETSAVASAVDLKQHGWQMLFDTLIKWLEDHKLSIGDEKLDRILNVNSFYNFFFSEAFTIDTEELVLLTARSSKYHASAAYRDRDSMLWSLPAVLQIESAQARRMIEYALTVQLRNTGVQSRFIDGIMLQPGFALDQLCSPIRALSTYVRTTRDTSILFDRRIQAGVNRIRKILNSKKHPSIALYNTMLSPSGTQTEYAFLTYSNALTWRMLRDLEWMYELIHDLDRSEEHKQLARQVYRAIMENCVVEGPFGRMFAWSVDLEGGWRIYDEPAGSLQLLSWLEFCSPDLPEYKNTVQWIHSKENPYSFHDAPFKAAGCEQCEHPTVLSAANDLLTGRVQEALDFLTRAEMDDGIACETVDENTGKALTGSAFAACAGYLAFALSTAFGARIIGPEPEPAERLYEPPPPEIRDAVEPSNLH